MMKRLIFPLWAALFLVACTKSNVNVPIQANSTIPLKSINPRVLVGSPFETIFNNEKYRSVAQTEFSAGEGLWYARWEGWPGEYIYNFTTLNKDIDAIKANHQSATVHMLVGPDTFMPDWLINGNYTGAKLDNMLKYLIYSIMDANGNKDKVDVWNVVNELFDDDGQYRTNMVWLKMGWEDDNSQLYGTEKINSRHPIVVRKAFQYCREKTRRKLEIRDFGIESDRPNFQPHKRTRAVYQLIKHMLNSNIPIDAVGIQGHLSLGESAPFIENNALKETVKKFKALGIEVYIMELDIRTNFKPWNPATAEQQKQEYFNFVKQAIEGGATRINFWGIQDDNDPYWLVGERPLLWDANLDKKPAYYGVKEALEVTK